LEEKALHFFVKLGINLIKMKNLTFFLSTIIFVVLCTFIIYFLEPDNFESLLNSFYFVMTTFSTVGYGDYSPISLPGKLFTVFMYLVGIGLLGVVIGKIIDAFTIFRRKREEGKVAYTKENHIIIIGWGKKTETAVEEILNSNLNIEIVIIDTLPKSPIDLSIDRVHYIQGDLEEETFEKANISKAKSVIIFADDNIQDLSLRDAKTLTVAIIAERLAPKVHTTVEILIEKHISNFTHVKVDEFILSQETISRLAVRSAMYKGVSKVFSQLISRQQHGEDLYKITKKEKWETYQDAFKYLLEQGATLIADRERLDINRRLDEKIPDDAELYVICNRETYHKIL
jgi:voltage-gated potassium channel